MRIWFNSRFIAAMRERYFNNGSALELSFESKRELGLTEASHWNLQKLKEIHIRMAEPLLLYWSVLSNWTLLKYDTIVGATEVHFSLSSPSRGPRFVLKEQQKVNPNKNYLYQQMQRFKNPKLEVVYPNPPTVALLPLRPKTCIPRVKREQNQAPVITDIFASSNVCVLSTRFLLLITPIFINVHCILILPPQIKSEVTSLPEEPPRTAPPPCTRRTYNLTDMFSVFKPKPPEKSPEKLEEEKRKHRLSLCRKTPKELLTAKIPDDTKRAASAKPAGTSGSHRLAPRPPSAPATNGRSGTLSQLFDCSASDPFNLQLTLIPSQDSDNRSVREIWAVNRITCAFYGFWGQTRRKPTYAEGQSEPLICQPCFRIRWRPKNGGFASGFGQWATLWQLHERRTGGNPQSSWSLELLIAIKAQQHALNYYTNWLSFSAVDELLRFLARTAAIPWNFLCWNLGSIFT